MKNSSRCRGTALVITLSMMVLMTMIILAFFSKAILYQKIEKGSTSLVQVEVFSKSVEKVILTEFIKEIQHGSLAVTPTGNRTSIYRPLTPQAMIPERSLGSVEGLSSTLIKQSTSTKPFSSGDSDLIAVPVTTDTPSLDGHYISLKRWNVPQFIGNGTDSGGFSKSEQLPEWVLFTRTGVQGEINIEKAKNKEISNPNYVIGRFAYNIYNVGGLIDVNTAGYPKELGAGGEAGIDLQTIRGNPSGIDLSQIPGINSVEGMDQLVKWRQEKSAAQFTNKSTTLNWYNTFTLQFGRSKGFMKSWFAPNGESDQRFLSRQDLIHYVNSGQAGISAEALPFLTSFSRDLDQPSYAPEKTRPKTTSNLSKDNYSGNDHFGKDEECNPDLLSVQVASPFIRNEGTQAVVGEPLIKKRFGLNRLAWLTYQGPSANRSISDVDMKALIDAGIEEKFLSQGSEDNIYRYFGLTWDTSKRCWIYHHKLSAPNGKSGIGSLSAVNQSNREADFFELLKAGISLGALAKGATNPVGTLEESKAFSDDTKVDYQILQIGANILDQFDADGYPTRIRFNDGTGMTEIRGSENLPYLYRVRSNIVVSKLPIPNPTNSTGGSGVPSVPVASIQAWVNAASLTDSGFYSVFYQPEVWNPNDKNSSQGNPRPSKLRIMADGAPLDIEGINLTPYNTIQCKSQYFIAGGSPQGVTSGRHYFNNNAATPVYEYDAAKTPASYLTTSPNVKFTWSGANTEMTFEDNSGTLFREPTVLTQPNIPAGSKLALGPSNFLRTLYTDPLLASYWYNVGGVVGVNAINDPYCSGYNTVAPVAKPFIGFYCGQGPMRWVITATGSELAVTNVVEQTIGALSGTNANTYRIQYEENGSWVTYDEKYLSDFGAASSTLILGNNGIPNATLNWTIGGGKWLSCSDPRSRRFGGPSWAGAGNPGGAEAPTNYFNGGVIAVATLPPTATTIGTATTSFYVDRLNNVLMSDRWDANSGFGWKNTVATKSLPTVGGWYRGVAQKRKHDLQLSTWIDLTK